MSSSARAEVSTLRVAVRPGASRDALRWDASRGWIVHVAAPPEDGKANAHLCAFLAREVLGVGRSAVRIRTGLTARTKVLEIDLPAERVLAALQGWEAR